MKPKGYPPVPGFETAPSDDAKMMADVFEFANQMGKRYGSKFSIQTVLKSGGISFMSQMTKVEEIGMLTARLEILKRDTLILFAPDRHV